MNKRDFYKELMSEYMFDKDKICANAKKGRFAGRKSLPIYIGMTAAVAAVVVVTGTAAFTLFDGSGAVLSNSDPLMQLNEQQRIERAIDEIIKNSDSKEEVELLVYFTNPVSPAMAKSILTGYSGGNIPIKALFTTDETWVSGTNEVGAILKNNTGEVTVAAIRCAEYLRAKIIENPYVAFTEKNTSDKIVDVKPINAESLPELPTTSEPVTDSSNSSDTGTSSNMNTSDPVGTGVNSTTHEPVDVDDPVHNPSTSEPDDTSSGSNSSDTSGDSNNSGTSQDTSTSGSTSEPNTSDSTSETNTSGSTSEPNTSGSTSDPNVSTPDVPTVDKNKLPAGVELPMKAVKPAYITDDIGAQRAYFLSEDVFYVKTENSVKLYKYNGESETLAAEREISDAKVSWVSSNGLRLMVSGVENGVRRKLYIIDAKNCTINDMQIDEMVGEGSITEAAYNESSNLFVMNVLDGGSKYIFTANLSGYHTMNSQIAAYGSEYMSILAAQGDTVYYSEIVNGATVIYKSGELENYQVSAPGGLYVSTINTAFTHAVMINESGISIFDPATESLIPVNAAKDILFGASAHSFSDGSGYFTISSGAIVPEERIAEIAKVDFTRSFSSKYAAALSNGSVRIIPSIYTSDVKSGGITFEQPVENAGSEQREAVNRGIGVVNAIASGTCKECGITTSEKLIETIKICFSENKANALIEGCKIGQSGESAYSGGSLSQITVSDTVLVMDNNTEGKLYIKVGTFEGKTAYTVKNVMLVDENGLKLDVII